MKRTRDACVSMGSLFCSLRSDRQYMNSATAKCVLVYHLTCATVHVCPHNRGAAYLQMQALSG